MNDAPPARGDNGHSPRDRARRRLTATRGRPEGSWVQDLTTRPKALHVVDWATLFSSALLLSLVPLIILLGEEGIDKAFQHQVRDYLQSGTSPLFMVIEHATPDRAIVALQQYEGTVIKTSLSDEDTKKLQEALQPPTAVGAGS